MTRRQSVIALILASAVACATEMAMDDDDKQVDPPECSATADCTDGDHCNGTEMCDPSSGTCAPGMAIACDDFDPCTADSCDSNGGCVNSCVKGGSDWYGKPCCVDEAAWLMRCVTANFPAGTVAYQVEITFRGGSGAVTSPMPPPSGWADTSAMLRRCPSAPSEDPRCEVPVTTTSSMTEAVVLSIVCRLRTEGSACDAGDRACAVFDPASREFVTSEYCSAVDPTPDAPPDTSELHDEMTNAFGWTDFEIVDVYREKGEDRCASPDPVDAPNPPHSECSGFESGSWMERCCSCCARGGAEFDAAPDPVSFGSCTCSGGVSLSCP